MEWPLFDLRLRLGPVLLRPVTDADLAALAALLPDDVELDPRAEQFPGLEDCPRPAAPLRPGGLALPRQLVAAVVVPGPGGRGRG